MSEQMQNGTGAPVANAAVTTEASTHRTKMTPGGFWIRFVAVLVDGIIINLAQLPLALIVGFMLFGGKYLTMGQDALRAHPMYLMHQLITLIINLVAIYFYFGWFYSNKGATPGKMIFNMKVLRVETGSHLSYGRAFLRETVGKFCSAITLLIGFIMAAFREDKRALHDLIADTQVLRRT